MFFGMTYVIIKKSKIKVKYGRGVGIEFDWNDFSCTQKTYFARERCVDKLYLLIEKSFYTCHGDSEYGT